MSKYYVYYDKKTGAIQSVTNEISERYEYGIEVQYDDIQNFLNGKWHFKDYLVGYKRLSDNSTTLAVMLNVDQGYAFRNNVFEWITKNDDADLLVDWNGPNKTWEFHLNPLFKKTYNDNVLAPKLVFFVTLETDFDFLVRTIFLDMQDLLDMDRVIVPFDSNIENKIDKVSISSKLVFKSYGLRIINE